ncbi:hypothetical protein VNO77_17306 [Canavalia gladiata]|uniref:Uncharacterized protein n=1 Tax=Canavalia gladiata TaxID=3824 RepID=A0AAN9LM84_CANGL
MLDCNPYDHEAHDKDKDKDKEIEVVEVSTLKRRSILRFDIVSVSCAKVGVCDSVWSVTHFGNAPQPTQYHFLSSISGFGTISNDGEKARAHHLLLRNIQAVDDPSLSFVGFSLSGPQISATQQTHVKLVFKRNLDNCSTWTTTYTVSPKNVFEGRQFIFHPKPD